ncbi:MAG: hypothetical protein ACREHD_34370, partial [Pirellulales bacterium]
TLIQSPLEADSTTPLAGSMKSGERSCLISLGPQTSVASEQINVTSDRELLFVFQGWQFSEAGQIYDGDVSVDLRSRMVDFPHELLADARASVSPVDGVRSAANGSISVEPAGNGERQGSIGLATLLGQSAETEATLVGGGRAIIGASPASAEGSRPDGFSVAHATVGYLVAFEEIAVSAAAGSLSVLRGSRFADDALAAFVVDDLLTPHFACDAAALSVAITDLAARIDELGVGVLDLLADPLPVGEAALVAGLVGAGLACRHWRGGRRDERAEQEELLSSRFLRGHASLRLAGGGSA